MDISSDWRKRRRDDEEEGEIIASPIHQSSNENDNNLLRSKEVPRQSRFHGTVPQQPRFHEGPPQHPRFYEGPPQQHPRFYDASPRFQPPRDNLIPYQKKGRWDNQPPDNNQMPPYERKNPRDFNRQYSNEWEGDRVNRGFPPPPAFQKVKSFGSDRNSFDRDYRERGPPVRDDYYDNRGGPPPPPPQNQYHQGPLSLPYDDRGPYPERRSSSAHEEWSPRDKNYNNGIIAPRFRGSFREQYPNDDRPYPNDRSFPPFRRPIENRKFDMREDLPPNFGPPPRFNNFRFSRFSQPQFRRWGVGAESGGRGFGGRRPWGFGREVAREEVHMNIEETTASTSFPPPAPTYNRIRSRFSKIADDNASAKSTALTPEPVISDQDTKNILQLSEAIMDYKLAFALASLDLKSINFPKTEPEVKKAPEEESRSLKQDDHHSLQLKNPDNSPRYGGGNYNRESRTPHDSSRTPHDGRPYDSRTPHDGRPYDNRTPQDGRPYDSRTPHDGRPYDNRTPQDGRPYDSRTPHDGRPYDNRTPQDGRPYDNRTPHRSFDNRPPHNQQPAPSYPYQRPPYQTPK